MKIAFLYIAEAYQCYHGAAVALELASRPGVEVDLFYNDPETPRHHERIRKAYNGPKLKIERLKRSPLTKFLQGLKIFGMWKKLVLRANWRMLNGYDVVITVENTVAPLKSMGMTRPKMVYMPHGYGDRAVGFLPRVAVFDLVLPAGQKTADRMMDAGVLKPENYVCTGYVKMETAARLSRAEGRLFRNDRPIVLYNPHKAPGMESWSRFIEPLLKAFAEQDEFNLIVAPHVKMFRRRSARLRRQWEARSTDTILIDLGSDRSLDNSYTDVADIYVGDISSQVYEFLAKPRPCLFLNAHGIDWKEDPNFRFWHLGDVIDDPAQLMPAIGAARERHALYRDTQEALSAYTLGDRSPGAVRRAADAILDRFGHEAEPA
ncbi:hypothetical protein IC614_07210 [Allosphingosinicella flava]|uniref:Glycerophosphotransferase n=1 Tax=Allosphingosinicella flava TaxID=2771430 RepID=A0A7T2LLA2_9SPHN|nr:hypothetical protein [Sphingosinicella flava]QPQ54158.1 hypothetical protein IC614_07210 [Sphingosinicella flava]